jgi:hypothetical protein
MFKQQRRAEDAARIQSWSQQEVQKPDKQAVNPDRLKFKAHKPDSVNKNVTQESKPVQESNDKHTRTQDTSTQKDYKAEYTKQASQDESWETPDGSSDYTEMTT